MFWSRTSTSINTIRGAKNPATLKIEDFMSEIILAYMEKKISAVDEGDTELLEDSGELANTLELVAVISRIKYEVVAKSVVVVMKSLMYQYKVFINC